MTINFKKLSSEELIKWNTQLRSQIYYAKRGWLSQMQERWEELHTQVKDEMKSRGLIFSIKISEQ